MKALVMTLVFGILVSCGNQKSSSSNSNNDYDKYVNAQDGVEYKKPSKVVSYQNFQGGQNQSEILLTLDNNKTFYLRASSNNSHIDDGDLKGVRGEWKVNSQGQLELKKNGKVLAQAGMSYLGYDMNNSNGSSLSLNFLEPVKIEVVSNGMNSGFNGNYNSYGIVEYSLQGSATLER